MSSAEEEDDIALTKDSDYELKCQACEEKGKICPSVGFCMECCEYLCKRCFDTHTLPKPCRDHMVLLKGEMDQLERQLIQKCDFHKEKFVKFFCVLHQELCCMTCVYTNHHACSKVRYILLYANDLTHLPAYQQFEQSFNQCLEAVLENPEHAKRKAETLDTSCTEALQQVKKLRQTLNEALDKDEAEILEKAEKMKSIGIKQLDILADKQRGIKAEMQKVKARIEMLKSTNQTANLYLEMLQYRTRLQLLTNKVNQIRQEYSAVPHQITFSSNTEILDNLRRPETLGTLTMTPTTSTS